MTDQPSGDEIIDPPQSNGPRLSLVGQRAVTVDRGAVKRDLVWIRMDTNLDLTVSSACKQLARHPNVYERSGHLVEIVNGAIRDIPMPTLCERLCETANFFASGKSADGKPTMVLKQPTQRIVQAIMARGTWAADGVRELAGVTSTPLLRPDGTLHAEPGYDPVTRHVYRPSCEVPSIPDAPTWEEARAALGVLATPIARFPFRRPMDQAVALSAYLALILTQFVRHLVPKVPAFGISATTPGTGKTFLAKIPYVLMTGQEKEPTKFPEDEIEMEKTIASCMKEGSRLILLDNIRRPVDSDTLCILTTTPNYSARILGRTEMGSYVNQTTVVLTGNNLVYVGDFCRRVVPIDLAASDMAPERQSHPFDPIEYVTEHRGELIAAALTVLRAWMVEGRPTIGEATLGSFEAWSRLVPQVLMWLGLPNPLDACTADAAQDAARGSLLALALAWEEAETLAGRKGLTVQDVLRLAYPDPPKGAAKAMLSAADQAKLQAAEHLADRLEGALDETDRAGVKKKIAYALRSAKGRILDEHGSRFEGRQDRTKLMHWSVVR